jgi:hypothetical protein
MAMEREGPWHLPEGMQTELCNYRPACLAERPSQNEGFALFILTENLPGKPAISRLI